MSVVDNDNEWMTSLNRMTNLEDIVNAVKDQTVDLQQERTQIQNRQIATDLLKAKLWERQEAEKEKTVAGYRSAIGRGMRSEKIRTYNYPQNRVTDHRIKKSWGNLDSIVNGNLDKIIHFTQKLKVR